MSASDFMFVCLSFAFIIHAVSLFVCVIIFFYNFEYIQTFCFHSIVSVVVFVRNLDYLRYNYAFFFFLLNIYFVVVGSL